MGHNDGGSLSDDDGRTDCPGQGAEVCYSEYDGVNETIYTFPAYLEMASALYLAKGARVVLSSATPDNPWETGAFSFTPNRFEYYAWYAAQVEGGPAAGVYFVSHGEYTAQLEKNLGETVVDENFPNDHTVSFSSFYCLCVLYVPRAANKSTNSTPPHTWPTWSQGLSSWDSSAARAPWAPRS